MLLCEVRVHQLNDVDVSLTHLDEASTVVPDKAWRALLPYYLCPTYPSLLSSIAPINSYNLPAQQQLHTPSSLSNYDLHTPSLLSNYGLKLYIFSFH